MTGVRILRKTKVVATIGPACDSLDVMKQMIQAGLDVARLNFSHGTEDEHRRNLERIRQASDELAANVAVLLATRGLEIRTGAIEGGVVELYHGDPFSLYTHERPGSRDGVSVSNPELAREVKLGSSILLDDGRSDAALTAIQRALELGFRSRQAYATLGKTYQARMQISEAASA